MTQTPASRTLIYIYTYILEENLAEQFHSKAQTSVYLKPRINGQVVASKEFVYNNIHDIVYSLH